MCQLIDRCTDSYINIWNAELNPLALRYTRNYGFLFSQEWHVHNFVIPAQTDHLLSNIYKH